MVNQSGEQSYNSITFNFTPKTASLEKLPTGLIRPRGSVISLELVVGSRSDRAEVRF